MTRPALNPPVSSVVNLDYNQLLAAENVTAQIGEAFGTNGLGVCLVRNVPDLLTLRKKLLILGSKFAMLPDDVKDSCTHPRSKFSFGW